MAGNSKGGNSGNGEQIYWNNAWNTMKIDYTRKENKF